MPSSFTKPGVALRPPPGKAIWLSGVIGASGLALAKGWQLDAARVATLHYTGKGSETMAFDNLTYGLALAFAGALVARQLTRGTALAIPFAVLATALAGINTVLLGLLVVASTITGGSASPHTYTDWLQALPLGGDLALLLLFGLQLALLRPPARPASPPNLPATHA